MEGVSIGVGKSSAHLGIVGSNPNLAQKSKEDSPNRGNLPGKDNKG